MEHGKLKMERQAYIFSFSFSIFNSSVFMPDDLGLIRDFDLDDGIVFQDDTLAAKAGFEAGVDSSVHEVFFLVGNFFQVFITAEDVHMAGAACADAAAVVVEVDVVLLRHFQDGHVRRDVFNGHWRDAFIFKFEFYSSHNFLKSAQM